MDRRMAEDLDRHITGNWGEDSVPDEDECEACGSTREPGGPPVPPPGGELCGACRIDRHRNSIEWSGPAGQADSMDSGW